TVPNGQVISQSPAAGTPVSTTTPVNFVLSLGPLLIPVPDVGGLTQSLAEAAITSALLPVGAITTANSDTVPNGQVISQSPAAGTPVPLGSEVNLLVSSGGSQPPPSGSDFRTQVIKLTIPAGSNSVTVTTGFEPVEPTRTVALISGITQHALGWTAETTQDPAEISARVSLVNGTTLTATRASSVNQTDTVWVLLIEYTGLPGGPNEMLVRDRRTHAWMAGQSSTTFNGPISSISNPNKVVVFGGGTENPNTRKNQYDRGDVRAWIDETGVVNLARGDGNGAIVSSHQVVEFVGSNWNVQTGDATPSPDPGSTDVLISDVTDVNTAWVYFTWSTNSANLDERGHRVWLTSPTNLRVQEEANGTGNKTIRWHVIHNPTIQVQSGAANNQLTTTTTGTITGFSAVADLDRAFAWVSGLTDGGGNAHPRDMWQFELSDPLTISLQRGRTGQELSYRYFVVELP
ncbi:MAG: PASTA domain-containing protein, partial [Nitrospirota bacterium]|nr:PASTA domain-containing protein [Nitrospirota bacterium]